MVLNILTYSRVGRAEMKTGPVNVDRLVHQIVEQYPGMGPPNAIIEISPLPVVIAHEASLTQIISNLLNNAVKFVQSGVTPKIHISGEYREGRVRLSIRDNGIGISAEIPSIGFSACLKGFTPP